MYIRDSFFRKTVGDKLISPKSKYWKNKYDFTLRDQFKTCERAIPSQ